MGLGALTDVIGPERVVGIPVGEVTAARLRLAARRARHAVLRRPRRPRRRPRLRRRRPSRRAPSALVVERELPGHRRPAAGGRPHPPCAGRCGRRLVRPAVGAADGDRRDRHRRQVDGHRPHRRDAVGLPVASRPDRDRLHRHLRRPRAQPPSATRRRRRSSSRSCWPGWSRPATTASSWRPRRTGWRWSGRATAASTSAW